MDNAAIVRVSQRIGQLHAVADDLLDGQRPLGDPLAERLPVNDFHRDVRAAVRLADVVNRADVRMVQGCGRARLAQQSSPPLRMIGQLFRQDLERDVAAQLRVMGAIHFAHTSSAKPRLNAIGAEMPFHGASQGRPNARSTFPVREPNAP